MAQIFKAKTLVSNTGIFSHEAIAPNLVYNTGDQNIDGIKNFYSTPTVNGIPVLLSGQADILVADVVYTTGNQTINGFKTFTTGILIHLPPSGAGNFSIGPLINITGSLASGNLFTGISINLGADNSTNAGINRLISARVGGTDRFVVRSDGTTTINGITTIGAINTNSNITMTATTPSIAMYVGGATNLVLSPDNISGNLSIRNGTNPTQLRIFNRTGTNTGEFGLFGWRNNTLVIGSQQSQSGILRDVVITGNNININGSGAFNIFDNTNIVGDLNVTGDILLSGNPVLTGVDLSSYLTSSTASSTYATITNVASTGSTLNNSINSLSGSSVLLYGDQSVGGIKTFRDNVYINNLFVTGTETIVNTPQINIASNYLLLNLTGGAVDGGIFFVTGSGFTGVNDSGPIIGFDHVNKFKFGISTRNSDLSTLPDIASVQDIQAYSGVANNTFSTISNLASTGSTLNSSINSLSGTLTSTYATISNLALTGSTLVTNLASTGSTLNSSINSLSGTLTSDYATIINLASTGSTLNSNINSLSGTLTSNYATISNLASTGNTLTTNLASTGSTLNTTINNLSGYINSPDSNIVFTTGDQTISGVKTFTKNTSISTGSLSISGDLTGNYDLIFSRSARESGTFSIIDYQKSAGTSNPANVTTSQPHNFKAGDSVVISDLRTNATSCGISPLNGTYIISSITSPTSFQYLTPGNPSSAISSATFQASLLACGNNPTASATSYFSKSSSLGSNINPNSNDIISDSPFIAPNLIYNTGNQNISGAKTFLNGLNFNSIGAISLSGMDVNITGGTAYLSNRPLVNNIPVVLSGETFFVSNFTHAPYNNTRSGLNVYFANNPYLSPTGVSNVFNTTIMERCTARKAVWNMVYTSSNPTPYTAFHTGYFHNFSNNTSGLINGTIAPGLNRNVGTFTGSINPPVVVNPGNLINVNLRIGSGAHTVNGVGAVNSVDIYFYN